MRIYNKVNGISETILSDEKYVEALRIIYRANSCYHNVLVAFICWRRLFMTTTGLLGVGLVTIQEGDQVWLLCNARTPMVLRPTAGPTQVTVVGECHIHGFMNGEMIEEHWGVKENIRSIKIV